MVSSPPRKRALRILAVLGGINLVILLLYAYTYYSEEQEHNQAILHRGEEGTKEFARQIEEQLRPVMEIADQIADDLTHGRLDSTTLLKRLGEDVEMFDYVDGLFVTFDHYKFRENREFFAPLYLKSDSGHELVFLDYDYTENDWFKRPLMEGAMWVDPFFGKVSGEVLIQYGVPFYDRRQEPAGIVAINLSPEELKKIVSDSLPSGESGYGFIVSKNGNYIYHPIVQLMHDKKSIVEVAKKSNDEKLIQAAQKVIRGERGAVETTDALSGNRIRIFFEPIALSGWTVGIHYFDERVANEYSQNSVRLIWLVLLGFSFLIILMVLLVQVYKGSIKTYWAVSVVTSLLFISGILFIWYRAMNTPPVKERKEADLMIVNEAVLQHFIEIGNSVAKRMKVKIIYVPTGVFVQHIQFVNAYNVMVSGYIWQTYRKTDTVYSDGDPISRGFIFAETEPNAEVLGIEEVYRKDLGDREVIGWYFRVSVREDFDYSHYPFDQQRIWLRLWHKDFRQSTILIPDLESYKILNPASLPGLEENFVLPNWSLRASYFDYKFNTYNTTFGVETQFSSATKPELYFNIVIQRKFLSPFITNIIPLIVIAILVGTVLMTMSKSGTRAELLGFSGFGVVELCAAFFFIVIISQIEIRDSLEVSNIIYLDYFYFLIYLMLLAVSVDGILFTRTEKYKFIQYKDNLIPKLVFWPVLLGILMFVTQAVFH